MQLIEAHGFVTQAPVAGSQIWRSAQVTASHLGVAQTPSVQSCPIGHITFAQVPAQRPVAASQYCAPGQLTPQQGSGSQARVTGLQRWPAPFTQPLQFLSSTHDMPTQAPPWQTYVAGQVISVQRSTQAP